MTTPVTRTRIPHLLKFLSVRLFLALALLGAHWAGQLHELSHAKYDLVSAAYIKAGDKDDKPSLDHGRDHCVVFQGLVCTSAALPTLVVAAIPRGFLLALPKPVVRAAERPPFSSRAPPVFS